MTLDFQLRPLIQNLTHVEAAAVPLGLITAAAALYNDLALPLPSDISSPRPNSILIWGGSSSIGSFGVQLAKLSGIKTIVAVCGPKNMDYVRSLGATHVLSHEDGIPAVVAKIKSIVGNDLKHAYDCISPATAAGCVQCLAPGGTVSCAAGPPSPKAPAGITAKGTASMIIFSPKKAAWGHQIWQEFGSLLEGGKLKVSPKVVEMNGLESVIGGLKRLEKGEVSSEKLVAVLDQAKARL